LSSVIQEVMERAAQNISGPLVSRQLLS
ncbi:hypothetical protein SEEH2823_12288, partial [Salmonella enterica subsp. enterica serovar Heidelberg str. 77-2823]